MSEQKLSDHLEHMDEAAKLACSFVNEMQKIDFLADKRTQQAVILNIMIIGEAATKLLQNHADFLERHPNLPWRSMKGMRNRVAHGYFDIDLETVWETTQTALPELLKHLPAIRASVR